MISGLKYPRETSGERWIPREGEVYLESGGRERERG